MNWILAAIVLTGLSANDPVPGAYLEVNFAQGQSAGSGSLTEVLLIGNKTTAGAAAVETDVYGPDSLMPLQTPQDAIYLFGRGSELYRMWLAFTSINTSVTVRAIVVAESAGAAATATTNIVTAAGADASLRVYAYDGFVDVPITSGDSVATMGANVVTYVNQMTDWGFTASFSSPTVTFTAKQKGPRGNQIRIKLVMMTTGTIGTTLSALTTETAFSGGTTADSNTNALATIANAHYYYLVSAAGDASQLGALVTQVGSQSAPIRGNRQRVIAASVDTLSNATTIATGRNSARAEILWSERNPLPEAELAADHAAKITAFEIRPKPRLNWVNFGDDAKTQAYQVTPAPRSQSFWPSRSSLVSALNNGLSPLGVHSNGRTYLTDRITTRSLNGSVNDYRIRDAHKVTVCDFFGDDLLAKTSTEFSGRTIMDDPKPSQPHVPGPEVVFPQLMRGSVISLLDEYEANDLIQNKDETIAGLICQRARNPRTRIETRIPLQPADIAKQYAFALDQVA